MEDLKPGFAHAELPTRAINLDATSLMWACAFKYRANYTTGSYTHSVREFQAHLIYYRFVLDWDLFVVLDGADPKDKRHEHRTNFQNMFDNKDS